MWSAPQVLLLEDTPEELAALTLAVDRAGLEALPAPSPRRALSLLDRREPLVAVLDLDMARVPANERSITVEMVLQRLRRRHANCIPLVYSACVETIEDQVRLFELHPHCLFQSKRQGEQRLLRRLNGLLAAHIGDLAGRGGAVVHLPSGEVFSHRIGVALMAAWRANHTLVLAESDARAARRFEAWLRRQTSSVSVRAAGNRHYRLWLEERDSSG
ncbi:MAG: hypothetical protein ACR2MZ_11275 [Candidatus Dormibacter sp.]|uniref:hypothetical protein n=1 Tax=Candidatus Dormibacter sp. TaxID=2973982 RepID=UPI000DB4C297|nr:MAG: hypothetical protein DLM66_11465 [Candidatus Dormibacteraeota bacterium]